MTDCVCFFSPSEYEEEQDENEKDLNDCVDAETQEALMVRFYHSFFNRSFIIFHLFTERT
jgi:hypothetical protein